MRRLIMIPVILLMACCSLILPLVLQVPQASKSLTPSQALPARTDTPTLPATEALLSPATPSPTRPLASPEGYTVHLHPDGGLYVGDQISLEVIAPPEKDLKGQKIIVEVDPPSETTLGPVEFTPYGIEGRIQATLTWAWDTRGIRPGPHTLAFSVQPDGPAWTQTVTLQPAYALPAPEPSAAWGNASSQCCVLYYITGTKSEQDLPLLMDIADEQAKEVSQSFGEAFTGTITVTLMSRVLGHGGFANGAISVSYPEENYAGIDFKTVLHHEMVHILDGRLGGEMRPNLLVEGLAVYLTGGHYQPEGDLLPRAASLLGLPPTDSHKGPGWYLPLKGLADNFYASQHEIGYLEAGALVEYMVKTWGWEMFSGFYRDIHPVSSGSQAGAIEVALQKHFKLSLAELEQDFLEELGSQQVTGQQQEEIRLTVNFYDTMRRYQQALDPSAYFRTAWLPDTTQMRQRGIVADYLRHPQASENATIESMLVEANDQLKAGHFKQTEEILRAINNELDSLPALWAGYEQPEEDIEWWLAIEAAFGIPGLVNHQK